MKEYVITLKNFDDLDQFYDDMETPGGNLYVPDRSVDIVNRRPISRNTHYMLSDEEAAQIRNDPRVLACELTPSQLGISIRPSWTQYSTYWDKSTSNNSNHKNWGLLRCVEGTQRSNWGNDSILTTKTVSGTIQVNAEGRNVDVVIIDGFINPSHPEMALNSDGGGGSRVVQYNWLQHRATPGTYVYGPYTGTGAESDNNHGMHVAGTVAGNTQGWARSANIYNISPYSTDPNGVNSLEIFDFIRAWHGSKSINPATGRKNPTITNNSYGFSYKLTISNISSITNRGITYSNGLTSSALNALGVINDGTYAYTPARYTAFEQDIIDAMNDGIICVCSAGNASYKIDKSDGLDYNNYCIHSGSNIPYHQGGAPISAGNIIVVGAIGTSANDSKASYSNTGPRIDIYAPGSSIMSSLNSTGVYDSRSLSYRIGKYSGTSMASPQVCGVLACLLEIYPNLAQSEAIEYLEKYSKYGQIADTNGGYSDTASLQGSPNRYLYYYKERADTGTTWPKLNYKARPSTGRL
ncbi:hypothetical protein EBS57_09255, partial [bacterium]|nr:hypothetical protein [bacterium]